MSSSPDAIQAIAAAVKAVRLARKATTHGFADDYCASAERELVKALNCEVGALEREASGDTKDTAEDLVAAHC